MPTSNPTLQLKARIGWLISRARARWMVDVSDISSRFQAHILNLCASVPHTSQTHASATGLNPPTLNAAQTPHPPQWLPPLSLGNTSDWLPGNGWIFGSGTRLKAHRLYHSIAGSVLWMEAQQRDRNNLLNTLFVLGAASESPRLPNLGLALHCTPLKLELYVDFSWHGESNAEIKTGIPTQVPTELTTELTTEPSTETPHATGLGPPFDGYRLLRDHFEGTRLPDWRPEATGRREGLAMACACEQVEEAIQVGLVALDAWIRAHGEIQSSLPNAREHSALKGREPVINAHQRLEHSFLLKLPPVASFSQKLRPEERERLEAYCSHTLSPHFQAKGAGDA